MPKPIDFFVDNFTDVTQFNPRLGQYSDKDIEEQLDDPQIMLYEWELDLTSHRVVDIIQTALVKGEDWVVYRVINRLGFDNKDLSEFVIMNAALYGRDSIIDFMAENGIESWSAIVEAASKLGDLELIKELDEEYPINWITVLANAAFNGFIDILEYALYKFRKNNIYYPLIAYYAAYGGHRDIVAVMVRRGDINPSLIAAFAARGNNIDLMEEVINNKDVLFVDIATFAAQGGLVELVFHLLAKAEENGQPVDSDALNSIAFKAAKQGHTAIVEELLIGVEIADGSVVRVTDFNRIAEAAASSGSRELLDELIDIGADNWEEMAEAASESGYKDIVLSVLMRCNIDGLRFPHSEMSSDTLLTNSYQPNERTRLCSW